MTDPMNPKPAYQARGSSSASGGESRPGSAHGKEQSPDLGDGQVLMEMAEEWIRTGSFYRALREKGEPLFYGEGDKLILEYPGGEKKIFSEKAPLQEIRAAIDEYFEANPPKDGKRDGKNVRS